MKFFAIIACLISAVAANGYGYGHHIPARIDVAPGGAEVYYTQKVIPQTYVTSYKTPITAPVVAKIPIIGKKLITSTDYITTHHAAPVVSYGHGKALY